MTLTKHHFNPPKLRAPRAQVYFLNPWDLENTVVKVHNAYYSVLGANMAIISVLAMGD